MLKLQLSGKASRILFFGVFLSSTYSPVESELGVTFQGAVQCESARFSFDSVVGLSGMYSLTFCILFRCSSSKDIVQQKLFLRYH